jgi:class 3 adenylate cyclase
MVGGVALRIAQGVAGLAAPGEALVSRTVRDLTIGSALQFDARGTHALPGAPGEWDVFAVTE